MVGYLNTHGTSPCLFGNGNEFVDLSLVHDDEIRVSKVSVLDLHDDSPLPDTEPFDYNFEETFWSSLTLGADADWDDEPDENPAVWVARRYADVIDLNERHGFKNIAMNDNDDEELHLLELSLPHLDKWSTTYRGPNPRRGNSHRQSTGWKRFADQRYRSA